MPELPPSASDPVFLELQTAVAGRYSLERELGRGGMGIVYLARDVQLDRPIAIKLLPPALAARPAPRARFLREARTAARLYHPSIVGIHAVEESGGLVWFVMAHVSGESLGARLRRQGAIPPGEVTRVLRDVAWAIGHAHTQGVVHRDVKPDNILLETATGRALIADFGIAAPVAGAQDEERIVGTVAYLSPEQARGDTVDGRADLYALGVVGYYALSGKLPYPVATLPELIERQLAGLPAPLATVAPQLPRALCRAIDRCLAHYPSARFQTAEEFAGALDQLTTGPSELPAPLRVWLAKGRESRGALLLWTLLWGLPSFFAFLVILAQGTEGPLLGALIPLGVAVAPWGLYVVTRLVQTRKVLAAGYAPADFVLAIRNQAERRREELAFEIGRAPTLLGRRLRKLTWGALAATVAAVLVLPWIGGVGSNSTLGWIWGALAGMALLGGIAGVFLPGRELPARDRVSEWREKFWAGPVGRLLLRIAGWRLERRGAPESTLHRPTEIALGEAADALFRALPAGQRRDLAQLPEQIKFLSSQAQVMRRRIEELDDLIAQAAPSTLFDEKDRPAGDGGAGALTEARTLWATQLRETVTLLESLRLGLLRLHAGSAVPDALTADLAAAHDLRDRLRALSEAHHEIDDHLKRGGP